MGGSAFFALFIVAAIVRRPLLSIWPGKHAANSLWTGG
jgi:hypothetical protein